jgi:spore germination protein KB
MIKISSFQLFSLIYLFEIGSALVVGIGSGVKQDAWIVILNGLLSGLLMIHIYHRLYTYFPDLPFTSYVQKITGKLIGRILGFIYVIYFIYDASRVLRDFGELLTTTIYYDTPLFFLNTFMILLCMYAVFNGIEVLSRLGELCFMLVLSMSILGFLLVIFSGIIHFENLKPILENGYIPVLKTSMNESILYPFGEVIMFSMIFQHINESKKVKKVCLLAVLLSGIDITIVAIINISALGTDAFVRSPFPLLSTIQKIHLFNFIERLDIFFMLFLVVGGFFKISLFFYSAVYGVADIFQFKDHRKVIYPIGLVILISSISTAANSSEHFKEGLLVSYLYYPVEIIIPILLLLFVKFQNRKKVL